MRCACALGVGMIAACGRAGFELGAASATDAAGDAAPPVTMFSSPARIAELSHPVAFDDDITVTGDLLEAFFVSDRPGGLGGSDIWWSVRTSPGEPWVAPQAIAVLNSSSEEHTCKLSSDGLSLWFASSRPPSLGGSYDLFVATRPDRRSPWSSPTRVVELATSASEIGPAPADRDALELYFTMDASGDYDIYVASRATATALFDTSTRLGDLDDGSNELTPFPFRGHIYFASDRTGNREIYVASGGVVTLVDALGSSGDDEDPWLASDGSRMFLASDRGGNMDLYEALAR